MERLVGAIAAFLALTGMQSPPATDGSGLSMWRLDCGTLVVKDFGPFFSDTSAYPPGREKELVSSCYLIRSGGRYLLWGAGVPASMVEEPLDNAAQSVRLGSTIRDQLQRIGVRPEQIGLLGISHYHSDHTGQAADFRHAKLLIGAEDLAALKAGKELFGVDPRELGHWTKGGGSVEPIEGDRDVFGDGSVTMLALPGHTPGHMALLVRLASGPVLLSGDTYHFAEQVPIKGVPPFNWNRADSLAAMDRFDKLATNLKAKIVIEHEPADVAKLPPFPQAAR